MIINVDKNTSDDISIREFYLGENDILLIKFKEELSMFEQGRKFEELSQVFMNKGLCISIVSNYVKEIIIIHRDTYEDFKGEICGE